MFPGHSPSASETRNQRKKCLPGGHITNNPKELQQLLQRSGHHGTGGTGGTMYWVKTPDPYHPILYLSANGKLQESPQVGRV
jgi:hypothetical protein